MLPQNYVQDIQYWSYCGRTTVSGILQYDRKIRVHQTCCNTPRTNSTTPPEGIVVLFFRIPKQTKQ